MTDAALPSRSGACGRLVDWFVRPDDARYQGIEDDLIRSTAGGASVVAFGCVCLLMQVAVYAFVEPVSAIPLALATLGASVARVIAMKAAHAGRAAAPALVSTAILWGTVVGLVGAVCLLTGHIVLSTVAALTVTGFAFTSVYNNAGVPRIARAQVVVVSVPFLLASALSDIGEMRALLVMGPIWLVGIFSLIARSHHAIASLILTRNQNRYMASNDDLTGIANRPAILRRIDELASRSGGEGPQPYLLYLDLDGFKSVNDTFGHATGDLVLRRVVRRFAEEIGEAGSIGRVGGDEFVIVLPGSTTQEVEDLVTRLVARTGEPIVVADGLSVSVGVTMGGAPIGPDGGDEALSRADAELYRGKRDGGGAVHLG